MIEVEAVRVAAVKQPYGCVLADSNRAAPKLRLPANGFVAQAVAAVGAQATVVLAGGFSIQCHAIELLGGIHDHCA